MVVINGSSMNRGFKNEKINEFQEQIDAITVKLKSMDDSQEYHELWDKRADMIEERKKLIKIEQRSAAL
jgi:hypothetical protein